MDKKQKGIETPSVETQNIASLRKVINHLLDQIRGVTVILYDLENKFNAQVEALKAGYAVEVDALNAVLEADEKRLVGLMKGNKQILFDGTDIVDLPAGRLLHETKDKVSLSKKTLELCKQHGFPEAIKIAESIDRSVLEKWADAKLLLVGGTRKKVESYNYEIKK